MRVGDGAKMDGASESAWTAKINSAYHDDSSRMSYMRQKTMAEEFKA
jgi:hypothetical protein